MESLRRGPRKDTWTLVISEGHATSNTTTYKNTADRPKHNHHTREKIISQLVIMMTKNQLGSQNKRESSYQACTVH
jgi:hypothetical protein